MPRRTTTLLVAASLGCWSAWLALVLYVGPETAWARVVFFLLLFAAVATASTVIGGAWEGRRGAPSGMAPSGGGRLALQGTGLALVVSATVWLQAERMLSPAHVVLLAGGFWLVNLLIWSGRTP